jgi:prevent-host-death family protein
MDSSTITVGAFEAKTHLSVLLDKVESGEEVLITRHGRPIARIVSAETADRSQVDQIIAQLKALRRGTTLGGLSWKALRDEGRR